MAYDAKDEAGDLGTGYRILDVKCARVEENAEAEVRRNRAPATVRVAPANTTFAPPAALPRRRIMPHPRPATIRYSRATAVQVAAARRKRPSRIKQLVRAERTPLLLALTGIAMSAFLAMLFSILEPRTSSLLSARDASNPVANYSGDAQPHRSPTGTREGGTATVLLVLKAFIILLPAMLGLSVLFASLLARLVRAWRAARYPVASAPNENCDAGGTGQEAAPATLPVETQTDAQHGQQQSGVPPQGQMRRAA
jgi:hypothetical protein